MVVDVVSLPRRLKYDDVCDQDDGREEGKQVVWVKLYILKGA